VVDPLRYNSILWLGTIAATGFIVFLLAFPGTADT
jgi:hypothetical protein